MDFIKENQRKLKIVRAIVACLLMMATLAVALSMLWVSAVTYTNIQIGKFKYTLDDSTMTATVTGLSSSGVTDGQVNIPASVSYSAQTFTVTAIGDEAFYTSATYTPAFPYNSSYTLTLPNTITSIGANAFYECEGLRGSLTLPTSLVVIGSRAFGNCYNFTGSLTIPASVTTIGENAFAACTGLSGPVTIVDTAQNPSQLTKIGTRAFSAISGATGINIPDSVTYLGYGAFDRWPTTATITWTTNTSLSLLKFGRVNFAGGGTNSTYQALYNFLYANQPALLPAVANPPFDGSQTIDGYESVRTGTNNNNSWLYKSASWTNAEKTTAKLQLDFSYTLTISPGVDFMFVLDTSHSMEGQPLNDLYRTASYLAEQLLTTPEYNNRVAFVTFGSTLKKYSDNEDYAFEDSGFTANYTKAQSFIDDAAEASGNTNYSAPLQKAYEMMRDRDNKTRQTVVIFMTDGDPNEGGYTTSGGVQYYGLTEANRIRNGNGSSGSSTYLPPTKIYSIAHKTTISASLEALSDEVHLSDEDMHLVFTELVQMLIYNRPENIVDVIHTGNFTLPAASAAYTVFEEGLIVAQGDLAAVSDWVTLTETGDVQTISWNMKNTQRNTRYKLIVEGLQLKQIAGEYPVGGFDTNEGNAVAEMPNGTKNEVISPTLLRDGETPEPEVTRFTIYKTIHIWGAPQKRPPLTDEIFLFDLYDLTHNIYLGGMAIDRSTYSATYWMYLDITEPTQIRITEAVPMEYKKDYFGLWVDKRTPESQATVDGNVVTIYPGDNIAIYAQNYFEHDGFFKGKHFVRNQFTHAIF